MYRLEVETLLCVFDTLDSTAGVWSQQVKFTLPRHLFTHLGFPECPCCLQCNINFIPDFVKYMD